MIRVSDASAWHHCLRQAWFRLHPPEGEPRDPDPFEVLMQSLGEAHEQSVLERFDKVATAASAANTQDLIRARVPVIYQPQFIDEARGVIGNPDFLILTDDGYQVGDAKLSLSIEGKKAITAQLGVYRILADSALPAIVYLGNGGTAEVTAHDRPVAEQFLADMAALASSATEPETHYAHSKCSPCPFQTICVPAFKATDELTLNPAIDVRARKGLHAQGIETLKALAGRDVADIADVPYLKGEAKKRRAVLHARSLRTGEIHQLEAFRLPRGPCVHFDVETDPLQHDGQGAVYLWGLLPPPHTETAFDYIWKDDGKSGDFDAWQLFLAKVAAYRQTLGETFVLVHYSDYEVSKIRQYAVRYGMEAEPIVGWLLSPQGPLFDVMKVVKTHLVLPVFSYGLKAICRDPRLVNFQWRLEESGSQWSVVRYYDYLGAASETERRAIKQEILAYNLDDVRATAALWVWLGAFAR